MHLNPVGKVDARLEIRLLLPARRSMPPHFLLRDEEFEDSLPQPLVNGVGLEVRTVQRLEVHLVGWQVRDRSQKLVLGYRLEVVVKTRILTSDKIIHLLICQVGTTSSGGSSLCNC